jgi:hypothetical protein
LAALVIAVMAAHDNYSKSASGDRSVKSGLLVLFWAIGGQLLLALTLAANKRYSQAVTVAFGALPLVAVAAFFYVPGRTF